MISLRAFALSVCAVCVAAAGCSTSSGSGAAPPAEDAGVDAPIGPLLCGVPVASTCEMSAACTFTPPACAVACQGYYVVNDGTWTAYYSASGLELAGEVADGDAGIEACPYGFLAPTGCAPTVAGVCAWDAGDAGESADAASGSDGASGSDAGEAGAGGDAGSDADAGAADGAGD